MDKEANLDAIFSALAHPVRRAILARLSSGEASVNELAAPHHMSLPAISRHIKVLEKAGLLSQHKQAQFRLCQLEPQALYDISTWADQYRPIWNDRFDRMSLALQNTTGEIDDA